MCFLQFDHGKNSDISERCEDLYKYCTIDFASGKIYTLVTRGDNPRVILLLEYSVDLFGQFFKLCLTN